MGKPHLQDVGSSGKNLERNDPIGACLVMQHTRQAVSAWLCPTLRTQGPLLMWVGMRGVSFRWYNRRKFEPIYFLDWNRDPSL